MTIADIQAEFGTDKKLETEGVWVYPIVRNPKIGFLIKRMSRQNRAWADRAAANYRKNKNKIERGQFNDPKIIAEAYQVFCSTVLGDWCEIIGKDNEVIPYNVKNGVAMMNKYPDLYEKLSDYASELTTFQQEEIDEIVGEQQATSTGS